MYIRQIFDKLWVVTTQSWEVFSCHVATHDDLDVWVHVILNFTYKIAPLQLQVHTHPLFHFLYFSFKSFGKRIIIYLEKKNQFLPVNFS